jgi:hypothetical protein
MMPQHHDSRSESHDATADTGGNSFLAGYQNVQSSDGFLEMPMAPGRSCCLSTLHMNLLSKQKKSLSK